MTYRIARYRRRFLLIPSSAWAHGLFVAVLKTAWITIAVDSGAGGCLGADAVNLEKV